MRRSLSILVWILVGAFASGMSLGYFLHRSNQERLELFSVAQAAQRELEQTKSDSQKLADEANQKIAIAQEEVNKKQEQIKALQEEQDWLRRAEPLSRPDGYYRSWKEQVSIPLKISIKSPPHSDSWQDDNSLSVGSTYVYGSQGMDQWLSISRYDEQKYQGMVSQLADARTVSFLVNGHLLLGQKGTFASTTGMTYVLYTYDQGTSSHLLWARTNKSVNEAMLLDTFASLTFGE